MLANLGFAVLVITLLVSIYGIAAALYGARTRREAWVLSARQAMLLTWPLVTLSALCLVALLVTNHFEVEFVYSVTSRSMPGYLKATALWGGQAGSLLFWSWLMAAFASAAGLRRWDRDREFLPWVVVVALVTLAFFLSLIILFENPFARLWAAPAGETLISRLPEAPEAERYVSVYRVRWALMEPYTPPTAVATAGSSSESRPT